MYSKFPSPSDLEDSLLRAPAGRQLVWLIDGCVSILKTKGENIPNGVRMNVKQAIWSACGLENADPKGYTVDRIQEKFSCQLGELLTNVVRTANEIFKEMEDPMSDANKETRKAVHAKLVTLFPAYLLHNLDD